VARTSFLWLEITGRCQLECRHCYATSGPAGTHGAMTGADWVRVLDEAAELDVEMVQFIGGEPTLHPDLPSLIDHAVARGLEVEVFSNLVHVTMALWETFTRGGVRLACSYYSDDPARHAVVTGKAASHARTLANIREALRRSIPLRVGVVDLGDDQRGEQAMTELAALGVAEMGYDRLRHVGRGVRDQQPGMDQLCGQCASGAAAISPDGQVWPCVFSRWLPVGNVRWQPLASILAGQPIAEVRSRLAKYFDPIGLPCVPQMCDPQCGPRCSPACNPQGSGQPCAPRGGCRPNYGQ
jgi:MoaA/NifB/PqqE/SkfB family radical SAM enzyme